MADFTGFSYGGRHSSSLGIIRVSGGDRYDESLHPEIRDKTAEIPGLNGDYYFGSDFGTRTFDIEIAFDHLTEQQFKELRKVFGTKHIQELIFDERPYKKYMAKLESPVELSYVCFDESKKELVDIDGIRYKEDGIYKTSHRVWRDTNGKERIYRGEGKLTFICHFPFAKSNFKVLPEAGNEYYEGSDEWAISSGILSESVRHAAGIDVYDNNNGSIKIYNPGDIETGFRLYIPAASVAQQTTLSYEGARLVIEPIQLKTNDTGFADVGVIVDTNTGLINGLKSAITIESDGNPSYTTSGNIYNEYVSAGYFFKLQPNGYEEYSTLGITSTGTGFQIFYDYLYF